MGFPQLPGFIKADRLPQHTIYLLGWYALFLLFILGKVLIAAACIPRYGAVIIGNSFLLLLFSITFLIIHRDATGQNKLARIMANGSFLLFTLYKLFEAERLLPLLSIDTFPPGFFITLSILLYSLLLAFTALYGHLFQLILFAAGNVLYVFSITGQIQNNPLFLTSLLLLQLFFVLLIFRSMKIIINQSRRTGTILEEQKRMNRQLAASEKQLMEQERLVSIVRLSAGLNHEINNPLTYLKGNQYFLYKHLEDLRLQLVKGETGGEPEDIKHVLEQVEEILKENDHGLAHISRVVERLKLFTSRSSSSPVRFNVAEVLSSCIGFEKTALTRPVEFIFEKQDPAFVYGRTSDFMSICATLVGNCLASFADKPDATQQDARILLAVTRREKDVLVTISDNSLGLDPDIILEVNEKNLLLEGTWMQFSIGIAMCKTILHSYGGSLNMLSEKGEGTSYFITLPCAPEEGTDAAGFFHGA